MRCMRLIERSLLEQVPDHLDVDRGFTIKLDRRNRPEPDILVIPVEADLGPDQTWHSKFDAPPGGAWRGV